MKVDEGSDQKSDVYSQWIAAHACLKTEFTEGDKCHNPMGWLKYGYATSLKQLDAGSICETADCNVTNWIPERVLSLPLLWVIPFANFFSIPNVSHIYGKYVSPELEQLQKQ